jgi:hypothetical protein
MTFTGRILLGASAVAILGACAVSALGDNRRPPEAAQNALRSATFAVS